MSTLAFPVRPEPVAAGASLATVARRAERVLIPLAALLAGMAMFALFLLTQGKSPLEFYQLVWRAGFGTAFSWENTLSRMAPLLLAALCVALPARLGLVVIGGEGAIVLGGVAAGAVGAWLVGTPSLVGVLGMILAGALVGGVWIGVTGWLRHWRGVNETIASLLLAYIAIALMNHLVEGPLRDPGSLNKPATAPIDAAHRIGAMPGFDVHWGLAFGVLACLACWILIDFTRWGFAARLVGANARAARIQGLPAGALIVGFCTLAGVLAGMAGVFEVAAVHGAANASLAAGYGYSGILIAFLAQHHPLAIIPVSLLLAGFEASSGLIQRRMDLPDATIRVMQGFLFIAVLLGEAAYGRFKPLTPERWSRTPGTATP